MSLPPWCCAFDADTLARVTHLPYSSLLVWLNDCARSLGAVTGRGQPLRFVSQSELPVAMPYERWIAQTGAVPTRDNLHDRYNALIWLSAPLTKARLNAVQADEIDRLGAGGLRGTVRDAATLWDENLVVVVARQDQDLLISALQSHEWSRLFLDYRDHWHQYWQIVPFGHALLEKLATPYKAITGHAIVESMPLFDWPLLDRQLLTKVHSTMSNQAYRPLPVMGIPGWDPANEDPQFYSDSSVFRGISAR